MCLNQTYSCGTVQFKVTEWWYNAPVIREFKLHPDATSAVPPGHPFPPSSRVPASDPSKAGMTARVQHFTMGGPGGGLFAAAQTPWRVSGYSQGYSRTNRRMYQAACGSKVFVAWTRHDSMAETQYTASQGIYREWAIGRLATFTTVRTRPCPRDLPDACGVHEPALHERRVLGGGGYNTG